MSLARFKASNHPQQTAKRGAAEDVDDRGTEPEFIATLEERFGKFDLDPRPSARSRRMNALLFCRECSEGKHRNCDGTAWDNETDAPAPCTCPDPSHMPARAAAAIADLVTDDAKARGL